MHAKLEKNLLFCCVALYVPSFFKAFDSLPHRKLIEKLTVIGLNPYILRWITFYLRNRKQYVILNSERSPTADVISGVPQGSVLGPLLCFIYINDAEHEPLSAGNIMNLLLMILSFTK